MEEERVRRKLAAILAADVAGYSRLMGLDEEDTLARLKELRKTLVDPKIAEHHGRIVSTTGDGALVEFDSVVDAVRCATEIQHGIGERNAAVPADRRIEFRMGINLGDVIIDGDDIHGDGVNIAARLQTLAEPGGICISRTVLTQIRGKLSVEVEDLGARELKNIAQSVHVFRILAGPGGRSRTTSRATSETVMPLPEKPSLAVLAFQNMSGDSEQEYFADGIVEDIITALSHLPWLFVIARNSTFTYKGKAVDVKQIGRELGVRYLLEGSVRKAGNRVRITAQLIDTTSSAHIWADRFDGALDDIFELQDEVTSKVVGAIEPRLRFAEIKRATRKPTESLDAYDLFLRALTQFHILTLESNRAALRLLYRALEIDPSYAPAAGLAAWCYLFQKAQAWAAPSDAEIAEGLRLARLAIGMGEDDPEALFMGGHTLAYLGGEHERAASVVSRALTLNPNSANAWNVNGHVLCYLNRTEPAVESFHRAMRLSPLDPLGYVFKSGLSFAHFIAGRYDEAMEWIDRALREQSRYLSALRLKLALCGHLGRHEDARAWLPRLLELSPGLTISSVMAAAATFIPTESRPVYEDGLRKAGMPE